MAQPKKKQALSPRHVIANRVAKLVREKRLSRATVAKLVEEEGKKFYQVDFGRGKVNVYGENFIQIIYEVGENKGEPVFETPERAIRFFRLAVLEGKMREASKIAQKKPPEPI